MNKFLFLIMLFIAATIFCMSTNFTVNGQNGHNYFAKFETDPQNASTIILGTSYIQVPHKARVVTQVDRVIRDMSSNVNVDVPPGQSPSSPNDLVPYMEGARVAELMRYADVKVIPITGVIVKKINGEWYAADEKGNYQFGVDPSKIGPLFAVDGEEKDSKIQVNTHGMNVLVKGALNKSAYLVVACGDLPGKAKAESYMASKGINCYAPCDRFTSNVMPSNGTGVILGGAPIRPTTSGGDAVIGAQPIAFDKDELIVIQTTTKGYPDQYCDTPRRYFRKLESVYELSLNLDVVDAGVGESNKIVEEAERTGANVIGVRVFNIKDKEPVEEWLRKDTNHRAILFHSAAYSAGYSLFFEFPTQVTGQDPYPVFIKPTSRSDLDQILNKIRSIWMS